MLIESKEKYIRSLISLWHKVFGDDEEYIKLFFSKAYFDSEAFAVTDGDEVVSCLYLLKSVIRCEGKLYKGRYLYAAATLDEYRGKGLMSRLIGEAIEYAENEKLDFIALVPATDSLYGYYERFGFAEAMYKYRLNIDSDIATMRAFREIEDWKEFYNIRSSWQDDMLMYNEIIAEYAFDCIRFSGNRIYSIGDKAYYAEGEELFCCDGDTTLSQALICNLCGDAEIYSNLPLFNAEKVRNGMVYAFNDELKDKNFYMNIALD